MTNTKTNAVIRWTKISTALFMALLAVLDGIALIVAKYIAYVWISRFDTLAIGVIAGSIWAASIAGFAALISIFKLLSNMEKDEVFDKKNTKLMAVMAWSLVAAGICAAASGFVWSGAFCLTIIALFMALVVLTVKVVFDKAIDMKNELDLTI